MLASLGMQPLVPLGPVQAPPKSLQMAVDGVVVGHVASALVPGLVQRLRQLKVALHAREEGWPALPGFPLPSVRLSSVAISPCAPVQENGHSGLLNLLQVLAPRLQETPTA